MENDHKVITVNSDTFLKEENAQINRMYEEYNAAHLPLFASARLFPTKHNSTLCLV